MELSAISAKLSAISAELSAISVGLCSAVITSIELSIVVWVLSTTIQVELSSVTVNSGRLSIVVEASGGGRHLPRDRPLSRLTEITFPSFSLSLTKPIFSLVRLTLVASLVKQIFYTVKAFFFLPHFLGYEKFLYFSTLIPC